MPPRKIRPDTPDTEAPEADARWFAQALPAAQVLFDIVGAEAATELLKPRRGRPRSASPKAHVNIRLDADIVQAFKSTGAGW